ncbi:MAG TPA: outer membrane lipoprotein carrier protein LolA [Spirochaetota bacterium]|jgi:outer membrane lipoprotein-sorting protein|nr:outer membrane lipoprotein carrier protein LolA [Spirochaetota bacterium]OQB00318.1 MAG: Outer-membrane lipoprotein carrier protein precursor [Spirochaetes bacterium ADurb.Bin218]HOK02318.1 outer membrane lipoprotein carrier protein LolA [Spirochaetota bacterium]HOK92544.1 outer membrane lipoprotein carrier protein LolA [Spirochaetota bacterium]HON15278.1 outer membrane lipoprotein carrier protein LolA [Spirochaetota bacterium]
MKKKSFIFIIFTIFVACFIVDSFAYKFDFVTVTDVVRNIKKTYNDLKSYQANFQIVSEKDGKKTVQSGVLRFKATDKLLMEFTQPARQKIVSNGEMMWIYIPSLNVVAEQDLMSDSGLFSSGSQAGLNRLFSKYHYRFASKEEPELMKDGSKMYTLVLKQKESRSGYRTINLWIREDYFIVKAEGFTSSGKRVEITLSDIKTNVDLPNGIFKFDIPASARVIKNPMISEE